MRYQITCEQCNYLAVTMRDNCIDVSSKITVDPNGTEKKWEAVVNRGRPWWQFWKPWWVETVTFAGDDEASVTLNAIKWIEQKEAGDGE